MTDLPPPHLISESRWWLEWLRGSSQKLLSILRMLWRLRIKNKKAMKTEKSLVGFRRTASTVKDGRGQ
jgi:hypothetical protein